MFVSIILGFLGLQASLAVGNTVNAFFAIISIILGFATL